MKSVSRRVVLFFSAVLLSLGAASGCGGDGPGGQPADLGSQDGNAVDAGVADGPGDDGAGDAAAIDSEPRALRIGGHWVENSYGGAGDHFGAAVVVDGDRAFVGAPGAGGEGRVYVFTLTAGVWQPRAELEADDGKAGDEFGAALALSGNTLLVGAPGRTSFFYEAGEAYLFEEIDDVWTQAGKLTRYTGSPDNAVGSHGRFGDHVALGQDLALVAAPGEGRSVSSGGVYPDVGAVYLYTRGSSGWSQLRVLQGSGTGSDDRFAEAMASDGETLVATCAVGDCWDRLFLFADADQWAQQQLTASGARLGPALAVAGDTVAAAVDGAEIAIFGRDAATGWSERQRLLQGTAGAHQVAQVALARGQLAAVTRGVDPATVGELHLWQAGTYGFGARVKATPSWDWNVDALGSALDHDGTWGAVGASDAAEGRGAAYFFTLVDEACTPLDCEPQQCGRLPRSDGCGGQLDCGDCTAPDTCGGEGVPNVCGCTPHAAAGPQIPGVAEGSTRWTDTGWARVSDDRYAEARALIQGQSSGLLQVSDFGLQIPAGATIEGIEVRVERTANLTGAFRDDIVQLIKGGVAGGESRAKPDDWPDDAEDKIIKYGHAADLWGGSWTAADLNSPDFGVGFAARYVHTAGNGTVRVDQVTVVVYYEVGCQ